MYSTYDIKIQSGRVFRCGNEVNPEETILILGSCRVVPYLNYLAQYNITTGRNTLRIFCIDPVNYMVDSAGQHLDTAGLLKALETDEHFLSILKETTIFIHEHLQSFGILNTAPDAETNIYQFGMAPKTDVLCPNFHDVFLLVEDFKAIDPKYQGRELTAEDEKAIYDAGNAHIERFCGICEKSSFPEFAQWFRDNYLERRLFHSFNHVSSAFTLEIFRLINEKFLHLPLDGNFWNHIGQQDIYANVQTPVTDLDRRWRPWKFD